MCKNATPLLFMFIRFIEWAIKLIFTSFEGYDPQPDREQKGMRGLAESFCLSPGIHRCFSQRYGALG